MNLFIVDPGFIALIRQDTAARSPRRPSAIERDGTVNLSLPRKPKSQTDRRKTYKKTLKKQGKNLVSGYPVNR